MPTDLYPLRVLLLTLSGFVNRHQADAIAYLVEENRILKDQLKGRRVRLTDDQRCRLAAKAKVLGRRTLNQVATIVTPDTLMHWHRRLIAAKWTYGRKGRVGRPGPMKRIKTIILRMATENPSWGYSRIQGELKGVGHTVAPTTVSSVLKANGIKPAPDRPSSWRSFIQAHWGQIAAMDFFTAEVWTPVGSKTHYVLFAIDLKSRRVHICGITRHPNEAFMVQVGCNLTDCVDGFLMSHCVLIRDRDCLFTAKFTSALEGAGVRSVLTPVRAPNCNAYAERFVLTIKSECLGKLILFGESSLRRACKEFVEHYHTERAHQGLGNERVVRGAPMGTGEVQCMERLGGILKHYRRAA